ncbi:MAG: methyltransferase domain-containing protein [Kordiimonadaceae bacterium]|nr:methyltransferase domain-containing protein [Kordiimonadaceae bacterium]
MNKTYFEKNADAFGVEIGHLDFKPILAATTDFQEILIADTRKYGRALFLDGIIQSTEADEGMYHEMLVHPVLAHVGLPAKILVAGAGEGASLRELLRHPSVQEIDAVEIDAGMIKAAREHLPSWHRGAFDDTRVTIIEADIFDHLEGFKGGYDAIVVDLLDPIDDDGAFDANCLMFNDCFLSLLKSALNPGGCIVMQIGERTSALKGIFPKLKTFFHWLKPYSVLVPSFHENWTFLLLAAEDKSAYGDAVETAMTDTQKLPTSYFSPLAFKFAAEQAAHFFKASDTNKK